MFSGSVLHGQTYRIINNPASKTDQFTEENVYIVNAGIRNLTSKDVTMGYEMVENNLPSGWIFSLCDSEKCNIPGPGSLKGTALLKADGKDNLYEINFSPSEPGFGELKYKTWIEGEENDTAVVSFSLTVNNTTSIDVWGNKFAPVKVYPNPTKENVFLSLNLLPGNYNLNICDLHGESIYSKNFNNSELSEMEIPLESAPGMYFIYIKGLNNNFKFTEKIIKN